MTPRSPALAALSGLLIAASFPAVDLNILAWGALIPLLIALNNQSVKQGFKLGGITGIVFFGGTIYWVTNSVHFYGHVPLAPAALITLLLCVYCALYPALFGAAAVLLRQSSPSLMFLLLPTVWTALELARTYVFSGFPWALLGYSQYRFLPMIQIADVTGVYGVSFLIVLVNTAVAEFAMERKRRLPLIAAAAALAVVAGYGWLRLNASEGNNGGITISVVQGNIEQDKKWDPAYQTEVIETYERLTREALKQRPDLVIWPETATPFYFGGSGDNAKLTADLLQFVRSMNTPLLTGSPTYQVKRNRKIELRNSAFLIYGDGAVDGAYHKLHLVPFGEYVPLKGVLFFVEKMVEAIGDFVAGTDYTVMRISAGGHDKEMHLSTVICYEIIFPDLVRRFVAQDAGVMTTITNDAWFGRTAAPAQHFTMAVLRAVENRVPIARAANTGISGFIDSKGRILETSPIFTESVLTRAIIPGSEKTFYTRYGDVFSYLCLFASTVFLLSAAKKSNRAARS